MLGTLDILIGFTVIMLIISMPVTMLTQALINFFNLRGAALHHGVVGLLGLLDPRLKDDANTTARALLSNPLVAKRTLVGSLPWVGRWLNDHWLALDRAGTVHREELAKLILNLVVRPDTASLKQAKDDAQQRVAYLDQKLQEWPDSWGYRSQKAEADKNLAVAIKAYDEAEKIETASKILLGKKEDAASKRAEADNNLFDPDKKATADAADKDVEVAETALFAATRSSSDTLRSVLSDLGISQPDIVLKLVRDGQLKLEQSQPELAANVRASMALIEHASSDFLAKFNAWFDQSMDRVSEVFVQYSRAVTFFVALAVALFLQLDSIGLVNRLATDSKTRAALVETATKNPERFNPDPDPKVAFDAATKAKNTADSELKKIDSKAAHDAAKAKDCQVADKSEVVCINDVAASLAETKLAEASNRSKAAEAHLAAVVAARSVVTARAAVDNPATADPKQAKTDYEAAVKKATETKAADDMLAAKALTPDALVKKFESDPDLTDLITLKLIELPKDRIEWSTRFEDMLHHPGRLFGILLTAALLSLGAPFWYALLQNLIKLRPEIATKDDEQRKARQTKETDPAATKTK